MSNDEVTYTGFSGLFNAVDNCILVRGDFSRKVTKLLVDESSTNPGINNESRLRKILFEEIKKLYNSRISKYHLRYHRISDINQLESVDKLLFGDERSPKGEYTIYPKTFWCNKCGHFKNFEDYHKNEQWKNFDPNVCEIEGCDGTYTQVSVLKYCEDCGKIEPISAWCPNCKSDKHLRLVGKKNYLNWKIECTNPGCDYSVDILQKRCPHKDAKGNNICEDGVEPTKFRSINVRDKHVYSSYVKITVDFEKGYDSEEIDDIIWGDKKGIWEEFGIKNNAPKIVQTFLKLLSIYPTEENQQDAIDSGLCDENNFKKAKKIKEKLDEIHDLNVNLGYNNNDYLILKENFKKEDQRLNKSFNKYVEKLDEKSKNDYLNIKKNFNIEDITYVPNVHLIESSIGTIKGINKFYDDNFVPHFEPHWVDNWKSCPDREKFKVYSYPFETEGIIFDLDKIKVANWIVDNSPNLHNHFNNLNEAISFLESLSEYVIDENKETIETYEFKLLKTLVHTFAHILIKRSSIYTGLNSNSFSEILFPNNAAFFLYSTSTINFGGLAQVFENNLVEWFNDIKFEAEECIFDPVCIDDKGACFSCVYLPEFVCSNFNQNLNRGVFIGNKDIKKGFWESIH